MDADAAGQQDDLAVLVGLGFQALHEDQRAGAALLLEDVKNLELPGYPASHVGRAEELPVAAAVESVAVEGQRHLEVGLLARPEVADGRRDVLPRSQRRADEAAEAAGLGRLRVNVERVGVLGGVGHVVEHLLADGEAVALRRRLRPDERTALAVADKIVRLSLQDEMPVTPMQVQKLTYFCHGWMLGLGYGPLFQDAVESWQYGPVIRAVYHQLKGYGRNPVPQPILESPDDFDQVEERVIQAVWQGYGGL